MDRYRPKKPEQKKGPDVPNLERRGFFNTVGGIVTSGVIGGAAGFATSKLERKDSSPAPQEFHKAWHEKTLAGLEKNYGEVAEAIKQQIGRHLTELEWCHSQIRTLESQLFPTDDKAMIEINEGFKNQYRYQTDFITSEIRRLSKPILEYHRKHNLPMPEGIPLPDGRMPGQEQTSL